MDPSQTRIASAINRAIERREPLIELAGPAGSGKSTIISKLFDSNGLAPFDRGNPPAGGVVYCAPTNRAARVLRTKGVPALTVDQLTTVPVPPGRDRFNEAAALHARLARTNSAGEAERLRAQISQILSVNYAPRTRDFSYADVIVVDEASMVSEGKARLLMQLGVPILAVGDPYQLPPVGARRGFLRDQHPMRFDLTEVHRQARDSGILMAAANARLGNPLIGHRHPDMEVIAYSPELFKRGVSRAFQRGYSFITYTNAARSILNGFGREALFGLGRDDDLDPREPLICFTPSRDNGVFGGDRLEIEQIKRDGDHFVGALNNTESEDSGWVGGIYGGRIAHSIRRIKSKYTPNELETTWADRLDVDLGYARTCHQMQGSEEEKVFIYVDDVMTKRMNGKMKRLWLYTAITRASKKCVLMYRKD